MNCFRWDMTCIKPDVPNCSTAVWFWLLAAGVAFYAIKGKK